MSQEKRRYPRADIKFELKYFLDENAYMQFFHRDISGSGISFQTDKEYPAGMLMQVCVLIGGDKSEIQASGTVVRSWTESDGNIYTAIDLERIESNDQQLINRVVTDYLDLER
ncbi:MAG: PilZ domain-containing protein [Leptospiraceae bacterium]|nr:PilZ domain-containing protein [Leptospiraceae bacterium]